MLCGCPSMPREGCGYCFSSDMNQQERAEVCKETCFASSPGLLQEIWDLVPDLPVNGCVHLGKALNFFESQFLFL